MVDHDSRRPAHKPVGESASDGRAISSDAANQVTSRPQTRRRSGGDAARSRLKPFRQGELDGLCGIYAIVNAMRLAASGADLNNKAWRRLFAALMAEADDVVGAAAMASYGLDTRPLGKLLKFAAKNLSIEHGLEIAVSRVAKKQDRVDKPQLLQLLTSISQEPRSAALIAVTGRMNHWTVLKSVARTSLELFDSDGYARVKLTNFVLPKEPPKTGREHVICPRDVFKVTLCDSGDADCD
jgi:hypothetical protein